MKLQLHGIYADNGNTSDVLLERSVLLGGDRPSDDDLYANDSAVGEVFAAKEALEKSQGSHSRYLVVLEPDET